MNIESEETIHHSQRFVIVRQKVNSDQGLQTKELVVMGDGVAILPITHDRRVCLIREWRSSINGYITQIPGGYAGSGEESALIQTVKDEMREELGISNLRDDAIRKLITYIPNGGIRNKIHIFMVEGFEYVGNAQDLEPGENIEVIQLPIEVARNRFLVEGELTTSATIIALSMLSQL